MSVETLAQALHEAGILERPAIDARVGRSRTGRMLLDGIIGEGLVSEANLVAQLARALSVPRYDPKERSPEPEALALLDARSAEELGVLPVAVRGGGALLWVALCDPTDEGLIGEVTRRTGRRVKACLIGPRELARALEQIRQGGGVSQVPAALPPQQAFAQPNAVATGQYRIPLPPSPGPNPSFSMPGVMPNGLPQPMQGGPPSGYPYGYPQSGVPMPQGMPQGIPSPSMPPPGMLPQQMMGQQMMTQPAFPTHTAPFSIGPPSRPGDTARMEEELAQTKQVVKVLTQMLVERGILDPEDLKRRLRAERERKS